MRILLPGFVFDREERTRDFAFGLNVRISDPDSHIPAGNAPLFFFLFLETRVDFSLALLLNRPE